MEKQSNQWIKYTIIILLPLFILLLSFKTTIFFTEYTPQQQNALDYLHKKTNLQGNYTTAERSHMEDVQKVFNKGNAIFWILGIILTTFLFYCRKDKEEFEKRNFWRKKYGQQPYFCAEMESQFHFLRNKSQNISNRAKNSATRNVNENHISVQKSDSFHFSCISSPLENSTHWKLNYTKFSKPEIRKIFLNSGIIITTIILLILLTVILNFESIFTLFHTIFFPQGNWQFPQDSFLIQTFPLQFFTKMSLYIFSQALTWGILFILLSLYSKWYEITHKQQ